MNLDIKNTAIPGVQAIWLELQDTVHAVDAMTTKTPSEAEQA